MTLAGGLVCFLLAAAAQDAPPVPRITWAPYSHSDLAGYNIYRSLHGDSGYQRLNSAPLTEPAFRDRSAQAGHTYYYAVTAVLADGRESGLSKAIPARLNGPPRAVDDWVTVQESQTVRVDVLQNDGDPDADSLRVVGISGAVQGRAVLNSDGTITYIPRPGGPAAETLTYIVSDGRGGSSRGRVTFDNRIRP